MILNFPAVTSSSSFSHIQAIPPFRASPFSAEGALKPTLRFETCSFDLQFGIKPSTDFRAVIGLRGGSIGVRGVVLGMSTSPGTDDGGIYLPMFRACNDDFRDLAREAIDILRERGVGRIHVFTDSRQKAITNFWKELGFARCKGESLWIRKIGANEEFPDALLPPGYSVGRATASDLSVLRGRVENVRELAFENWEFDLIEREMHHPDRYFYVVRHDGEPIGLSIGGRLFSTATFTHTWIDEAHRGKMIGHSFANSILKEIAIDNVRLVYLMTVKGNDGANRFWRSIGFRTDPTIGFLEKDVPIAGA